MASTVIATEWNNQNSLRNFPFREDCGLRPNDSVGSLIEDGWRLPNYLITDIYISVNADSLNSESSQFEIYLKKLSYINKELTLVFADNLDQDAFIVTTKDSTVCNLLGIGNYKDATGVIHFGDLERFFQENYEGLFIFSVTESSLEPTCIRPNLIGLKSIAAVDASGYTTQRLYGDVKLIAGDNIHIKYLEKHNTLIISATPDSGYTEGCLCGSEESAVVKTINGIRADNVDIIGDDCVDVSIEDGNIKIKDTCSKPCCGCAETAFINQTINDLQSSVNVLTSNADILSEKINSFITTFLLARKTIAQ